MVLPLHRPTSLLVLLLTILSCLLTLCIAEGKDAAMIEATRAMQRRLYSRAGYTFRHLRSFHILSGPDVATGAWELVQSSGAMRVDRPSPFSRILGRKHEQIPYFFSIVSPLTRLSEEMRLREHAPIGHHKAASFLWKWEDGRPKLVHVDLINFLHGVRWRPVPLREIIEGA